MRKRHERSRLDDVEFTGCDVCATEYHEQSEGKTFRHGEARQHVCLECLHDLALRLGVQIELDGETTQEQEDALDDKAFEQVERAVKLERVLSFAREDLCTVEDVAEFFDALSALLSWHPDSDFADYLWQTGPEAGEEIFTEEEATGLNTTMQRCFELSQDRDSADVYDLALKSAQRAGWAPKPEETHPEQKPGLTREQQLETVLREMAENMIECRMSRETTRLALIDGGCAHELLERANALLGGKLPGFD